MLNETNKHSFCSAHWDDIHFSPSQGYIQGCCKSIPCASVEELEERKQQSLIGIRPDGCEYCWNTERSNKESYRHFKISKWDKTDRCRLLTLTLGNLCNFQCTYCNEKYSSRWQSDKKRNGEMFLEFDREVYYGGNECINKESQVYIDFYNKTTPTEILTVTGGEPLMGNVFYDILDKCDLSHLKEIRVSTNLNYPTSKTLDKLLELDKTQQIVFNASIDTLDIEVQEYLRFGLNMESFLDNMHNLLDNTNAIIRFNSLITANTVTGIYELYEYIESLKLLYPDRIGWFPSYCVQPRIHGFETLNLEERDRAIKEVKAVLEKVTFHKDKVQLNGILTKLESTEFNAELSNDQQSFFKQFSERHNMKHQMHC